ncbi:ubiquinone biosynthesis O-methyltransferase, partial [Ascobolus immersus RN42]
STIDPTELSHFSTLASTWWAPHGSSRLLHLMNPLRLQFLSTLPKATTGPNSTTYLDVGCGGGILSESLARLPTTRSVTGLEPGPEVFKIALSHARTDPLFHPSKGKLRYLNMSVEAFSAAAPESVGLQAQEDKKVDIVTLMEVLEHTPTPRELLGTLFPLVKPGGWLALSTISRTVTSYLTTKLVAEDLLRIVPRGTHDWGKYLRPEEV